MGSESAFEFETITVPSANVAVGLTSTVYNLRQGLPCRKALITVNPGPVLSYTIDGTTVGSATGHQLTAFGSVTLEGYDNIRNFSTTSVSSGTTGSISATYFR